MNNCLPSIVSATLCLLPLSRHDLCPLRQPMPTRDLPPRSSEIYVGDNKTNDENYDISLFERGTLHGFIFQGVVRFSRTCKYPHRPSQGQAEREGQACQRDPYPCWHR